MIALVGLLSPSRIRRTGASSRGGRDSRLGGCRACTGIRPATRGRAPNPDARRPADRTLLERDVGDRAIGRARTRALRAAYPLPRPAPNGLLLLELRGRRRAQTAGAFDHLGQVEVPILCWCMILRRPPLRRNRPILPKLVRRSLGQPFNDSPRAAAGRRRLVLGRLTDARYAKRREDALRGRIGIDSRDLWWRRNPSKRLSSRPSASWRT